MPKTLMQSVIAELEKERNRLQDELRRVTAALTAFGKVYMRGGRTKGGSREANDFGGWTPEDRGGPSGPNSEGHVLAQFETFKIGCERLVLAHLFDSRSAVAICTGRGGRSVSSTRS
jgi:hypothetical protein